MSTQTATRSTGNGFAGLLRTIDAARAYNPASWLITPTRARLGITHATPVQKRGAKPGMTAARRRLLDKILAGMKPGVTYTTAELREALNWNPLTNEGEFRKYVRALAEEGLVFSEVRNRIAYHRISPEGVQAVLEARQ